MTVKDQSRQIKRRGMGVSSHTEAKHYLRSVGYYRFEGYWWTMQRDSVRHLFRRGSSFAQVIERYNFDRELRLMALNMVERVEIGVRTQIIYHLSLGYGPFWFEDGALKKTRDTTGGTYADWRMKSAAAGKSSSSNTGKNTMRIPATRLPGKALK